MTCQKCRAERDELTAPELERIEAFELAEGIGILEVARQDDQILPTLINGKPVDRADWLEVVRIGNQSCSATLVGMNCALTAAHCGRDGERGPLEIFNGPTVTYTVRQMPQYQGGSNYDLSVLVLDSDVSVPFATVGLDHQFINGQDVDIAGYGCTRPGGGGGNDGILRWGESKVVGMTGTDVVTQWRSGGAALCFGDSGGPMFADGSNTGERIIIGINSKGNIRDTNYNLRLDLDSVKEFLANMASRYDLEIYGLNAGDEPAPPPDPGPGEDRYTLTQQIAYLRKLEETSRTEREKLESLVKPNDSGGGLVI